MKKLIASFAFCAGILNAGQVYDIVIYGGTSAGIAAAVQAKRMNRSVVLIEPTHRVGGMTTGGLGQTDIGNKAAIGGISREFYQAVYRHYTPADKQQPDGTFWKFEPSVALGIYNDWMKRDRIKPVYGERLDRSAGGIVKKGASIASIKMESGKIFEGRTFIDATYEGDLLALAGVSYHVGRESNSEYGETLNGTQVKNARYHQFMDKVSPYIEAGNPASGLLPFIEKEPIEADGTGDKRLQAYCYRMCLTAVATNRIEITKPTGYNALWYEMLLRNFDAGETGMPLIISEMPNGKTDINNRTGVSTDFIGENYEWADAGYARRDEIAAKHRLYQQGLMWTLANNDRVPEKIRTTVAKYGLCKDEFQAGGGWQEQLYIREARRMISDFVMTEHHCRNQRKVERPVGLAAYNMDSHNVRRYVTKEGWLKNEGDVQVKSGVYGIDLGAIVPKKTECENLIVPVCVSSSHIAFGSIRMEPVFMILGQSAATLATFAVEDNLVVQDVDYSKLRACLEKDGQRLVWEK